VVLLYVHRKAQEESMSASPTPDPELVTVFDTQDEPEAMVVHALLTSAGIESLLSTLQAQQDVLPGVGGIVLRVNPAQANEARRVIEEYRNAPAAEEDDQER
jgi:Putative prokaryotic signal transducing protein